MRNCILIITCLVTGALGGCKGGSMSSNPAQSSTGSSSSSSTPSTPSPPASPSPSPSPAPATPSTSGVPQIFPATNPWNQDISKLPVHANSANYIASIGLATGLHPDFGTTYNGAPNGIPFVLVSGTQARVPVTFQYASESDPGPYPIPANAPIEGGSQSTGDRHVIVIDTDNKKLYETFSSYPDGNGGWKCGSGAIFDLASNNLRPAGWTSADAAGLPIFPGLVRYDEAVTAGKIEHALRFTIVKSQHAYIDPARHYASSDTNPNLPPMGLRVRLKASVDLSSYPPEVKAILQAMKTYGMFVADNGSNWFVSGAPDSRWNDSNLAQLSKIKGSDFEAVETGPLITK
jgi:hypothetical protein